jgi:hypothetical protein
MAHVIARRIAKLRGGFDLPGPAALLGILLLGGITKAGHGTWAVVTIAAFAVIYALALAAQSMVNRGH